MKNPLSGSKAVLGTEQYERLTTKVDDLLQNYQVEMTKVMMGVTELEIEQKTAKLISAMHEYVANMANMLTIFKLKTNQQGWTTGLTEKEIAGHAAMRMYEQLGNNFPASSAQNATSSPNPSDGNTCRMDSEKL